MNKYIKFVISIVIVMFIEVIFSNVSNAATAKVTVSTANLRAEANTTSTVLEHVQKGEEVEILEQQDTWYKVKYKKIVGYLRNDLIEVLEDNTSNVEEETPKQEENTNNDEQNTNNDEQQNIQEENIKEVKTGTYKVKENLKAKIIPLITSLELYEINSGDVVEVTLVINNWARIKTKDLDTGWVLIEKLEKEGQDEKENQGNTTIVDNNTKPEENNNNSSENTQNTVKIMYVNSQTINVREKASTSSKVIKQLKLNTEVKVLAEENGWYKVDIDKKNGYIASNLLSTTKKETSRGTLNDRETTVIKPEDNTKKEENKKQPVVEENKKNEATQNNKDTNITATPATNNNNNTNTTVQPSKGEQVIAYAKKFLGYKYVYGGTTPKGFDCSGFTQYVYKNFGVSINRTAQAQYKNGKAVSKENLQIGDLLMFGTSSSNINHVGIYIGGNMFIHAANSKRGVTTDTISSGYYKTYYIGARRVI